MTNWTLAARAAKMNPSVIREILKVTEKPGIISLAGGLPSPKTFPVDDFARAAAPPSTASQAARMASTGKVSGEGRPPAKLRMPGRSVTFRISRIADGFMAWARSASCQGVAVVRSCGCMALFLSGGHRGPEFHVS